MQLNYLHIQDHNHLRRGTSAPQPRSAPLRLLSTSSSLLTPPVSPCSSPSTMQRSSFAPPPAHSPPLHHPVPQHVSTVPMMRSPPPPVPPQSQSAGYGNPYQPAPAQGGSGTFAPGFGGFINEPTAQMGFQVGKTAMMAGQEYMEQNVWKPSHLVQGRL